MYAKTLITITIALIGAAGSIAQAAAPASSQSHFGDRTVVLDISGPASTLTRDEVRAELVAARAAGQLQYGESALVIEPAATGPAKTRAQVQAETLEAIRLGAISQGERDTFASAAQNESIRLAGLKALQMNVAAR